MKKEELTAKDKKEKAELAKRVEKLIEWAEKMGKITEETKDAYDRCKDLKEKAKAVEEINRSMIILYRANKDWMKIGGFSAEIIKYRYNDKIGIDLEVKRDSDGYHKFKTGTIQIKNSKRVVRELSSTDLEVWKKMDNLVILRLPERLTLQELEGMRQLALDEQERMMEVLGVKEISPSVWFAIKELSRQVSGWARTLERSVVEYLGKKLVDDVMALTEIYLTGVYGEYSKKEMWAHLTEQIEVIKLDLTKMWVMEFWEDKKVGRCTVRVEQLLIAIETDRMNEGQKKKRRRKGEQEETAQEEN